MVTILVAPSPSRTMAWARLRATSPIATSSLRRSRRLEAAGPWPVAARISESLVEVSPSTVTQLKERSTTRSSRPCSPRAGTCASVAMKPSIVAISGRIMPAPLAMPVTTAMPRDKRTLRDYAIGRQLLHDDAGREGQDLLGRAAEMARECIAHLHGAAQALVTGAGVGIAGIDDQRLHTVLQMLLGKHHWRGTEAVLRKHAP